MPDDHRAIPFDVAFGPIAGERFPPIRVALERGAVDARDRDAMLIVREAAELLHDMRPAAGGAEGIAELAALLHQAYVFWADGQRVCRIGPAALETLLAGGSRSRAGEASMTYYLQLPPRKVWGTPVEGGPAEPLDGWFVTPKDDHLQVTAVFGFHPARAGFTVVDVAGPRLEELPSRPEGTRPFASLLPGGAAAGLYSVLNAQELVALAWHAHDAVRVDGAPRPGVVEVGG